ncbi:hypothetical protein [Streptomyces sp. NPDC020362]|uniref:NACHT domain-containing protein n=1 Tax=unclassified Streptomyces TaxID=2593676 RepID=UPI0033E71B72
MEQQSARPDSEEGGNHTPTPGEPRVEGVAALSGSVYLRGRNVAGRDIRIDEQNVYQNYVDSSRTVAFLALRRRDDAHAVRLRVRRMLTDVMRQTWLREHRTETSESAPAIPATFQELSGIVSTPYDTVYRRTASRTCADLPTGIPLAQVRHQVGNSLLLVGEPGTGKTFQLLELAGDLLDEAAQDVIARIPVYFHLALWTKDRAPLLDWMAAELGRCFHIPARLDVKRVIEAEVLPVLDGLDEVPAQYRHLCVDAVNHFRAHYGDVPMVVGSREKEYTTLRRPLILDAAVRVRRLSPEEVNAHLAAIGSGTDGLREVAAEDKRVAELLRTPLFLRFAADAYTGLPADSIVSPGRSSSRRTRVMDDYVKACLQRPLARPSSPYDEEHMLRWMSWLARAMRARAQPVFHPDRVDPSWLPDKASRLAVAADESLALTALCVLAGCLGGVIAFLGGHFGLARAVLWLVFFPASTRITLVPLAKGIERLDRLHVLRYIDRRSLGRAFMAWLRFTFPALVITVCVADLLHTEGEVFLYFAVAVTTLLPVYIYIHSAHFDFRVDVVSPSTRVRLGPQQSLLVGFVISCVYAVHQIFLTMLQPAASMTHVVTHSLATIPLIMLSGAYLSGLRYYIVNRLTFRRMQREGIGPKDYERFLDQGARCVLLSRTGSGYQFLHAELLEYFAHRPQPAPAADDSDAGGCTR